MVMYNFPAVFQSIMVKARDQAHLQRCIQYVEVKTGLISESHPLDNVFRLLAQREKNIVYDDNNNNNNNNDNNDNNLYIVFVLS